jgi:hypothetical protein
MEPRIASTDEADEEEDGEEEQDEEEEEEEEEAKETDWTGPFNGVASTPISSSVSAVS